MSAIERLLEHEEAPSVSLFLSTTIDEGDSRIGRARLKSLVDAAETRIDKLRLCDPRHVLRPARELLDDGDAWRQAGLGVALYLAPSWHDVVATPFELPELMVVGRRPSLRPLIAGHQVDQHFYILALSRNQVRLFEASRYTMRRLELDVPAGMSDALSYVEREKPQDAYHQHGGNEEIDDERVAEYLRLVDPAVVARLDHTSPLVLAGVEDLHRLYRRVTSYAHVLAAGVAGNHDDARQGELHDEAWRLVEPLALAFLDADLATYAERAAKGHVVVGPQDVLMAALQGRLQTLFVARDDSRWGTFSSETGEVRLHDGQEPDDEDLLELAAAMTLRTGGRVWALAPDRTPDGAEVAGLTRY